MRETEEEDVMLIWDVDSFPRITVIDTKETDSHWIIITKDDVERDVG
jgi:hypothetical protein